MSYWLVNLVFLTPVAIVGLIAMARALRRRRPASPLPSSSPPRILASGLATFFFSLAVLLVLTAVFDNVMIAVGLIAYSSDVNSGILIGSAPLQDFAYPLAAAILLPALWTLRRQPRQDAGQDPGRDPGRDADRESGRG